MNSRRARTSSTTVKTRTARTVAALDAARKRSGRGIFFGVVRAYCDHVDCPVREITIDVKELVRPITAELRCPACRRLLILRSVETRDERHGADEAAARRSVIDQLYERQHPGEATPLAALSSVSLDDLIARVLVDGARGLDTFTAARQARIAIERLLALNDWPEDRALSLAIDRLLLLEEQAAAAVRRADAWRRSA
jgi:hypothetical protein